MESSIQDYLKELSAAEPEALPVPTNLNPVTVIRTFNKEQKELEDTLGVPRCWIVSSPEGLAITPDKPAEHDSHEFDGIKEALAAGHRIRIPDENALRRLRYYAEQHEFRIKSHFVSTDSSYVITYAKPKPVASWEIIPDA